MQKQLIFTVTSGRSGTKLLAVLLREVLGIDAEHEPAPRANFALRRAIDDPFYGLQWLIEEKLPVIAALPCTHYAETSHIYCKGLIEPLLDIGLRPKFIILRRPADAVAQSLFKMNVIPGRTDAGRLVLLSPEDSDTLPLPDWQQFSDYQLCYWYAREIERRQALYKDWFSAKKLSCYETSMSELVIWESFIKLSRFIRDDSPLVENSRQYFQDIVSINQHPRHVAHTNHFKDRILPEDTAQEEHAVDHACMS
jgi:hypothetical protein